MKLTDSIISQTDRFINKVAQKFPVVDEPSLMTDIHFRISQDTGELVAFDDNDDEITRCVVDGWINNQEDDFYDSAASVLRRELERLHEVTDNMGILKPYSFVMENEEGEHLAELYLVDSDIKIIGGDLMSGLDDDLDKFFDNLFKR